MAEELQQAEASAQVEKLAPESEKPDLSPHAG